MVYYTHLLPAKMLPEKRGVTVQVCTPESRFVSGAAQIRVPGAGLVWYATCWSVTW
ncbi:hypothetical protein SAMN05421878_11536 [Actinobaculum suis]|uniref:Uncharacterized protein n=1 Tax=Actinobaculum suis TaxID=1657 RepID=A0A1G7E7Y6_9ACTO|nr:hypothetical protein SAMN05421878_11536 [Actinobaculum suis]VDG76342.1 Uncharacterised protein [Actinobaculum suis]